jgi:nitrogen fixation protein NifU and related proteins
MDLKQLYRDVILDHYKHPRNAKELTPEASGGEILESRCKNPSCGDRITLQLRFTDGRLSDIGFQGVGCAISQASASMMTLAAKGRTPTELAALESEFREMIVGGKAEPAQAVLGDLITLQGVSQLHARVKCAMCAWSALEAAIEQRDEHNMDEDASLPQSAGNPSTTP